MAMVITAEYKTAENYLQMLYALSKEARLYVLSKLTDSLLREEAQARASVSRRRAKVVSRSSASQVTDAQLDARFSGKPTPDYPTAEPTWAEVIDANSGRTIKPIEKWL